MKESQKRAQKRYDETHKDQFKRIDIKVNKESYEKELAFLATLPSRQKFIMWLISNYVNKRAFTFEEAHEIWEHENGDA